MGLFESQKSRNKRIFRETFEYLLGQTAVVAPEYTHVCGAWLFGASFLANSLVEEVRTIKKAWGKGDRKKLLHYVRYVFNQ